MKRNGAHCPRRIATLDRSLPTGTISHAAKYPQDDSQKRSPTEQVADILYYLLYRGERIIADDPDSDLSYFAPHHEDLSLILRMFDDAGGGKGAMAANLVWRVIRGKWPELAAAVAGQDIRKAT